jgi:hypothetical protein
MVDICNIHFILLLAFYVPSMNSTPLVVRLSREEGLDAINQFNPDTSPSQDMDFQRHLLWGYYVFVSLILVE